MLPVYAMYFAGGRREGEKNTARVIKNSLGFILGFTLVFIIIGAFAGSVGRILLAHRQIFDIVCGIILILLGLVYMGVITLKFNIAGKIRIDKRSLGFFSSALFGIVFSVSWTPCTGPMLGTAIVTASQSGQIWTGIIMLLCFSAGLGIPLFISALFIGRLGSLFDFFDRHSRAVNITVGIFIIASGILIMTGLMGNIIRFLNF